ncbi:hypothetical protein AA0X95_26190 [Bacillus sp. 1P10SD]
MVDYVYVIVSIVKALLNFYEEIIKKNRSLVVLHAMETEEKPQKSKVT